MSKSRNKVESGSTGRGSPSGFAGEKLSLDASSLHALTVSHAENLQCLEIRNCDQQHSLHLLLEETPCLNRIILPDSDRGATIHLDQPDGVKGLEIQGPVQWIEAHFPSGSFRIECKRADSPWRLVRFVEPVQVAKLTPGAGLVVVTGRDRQDPGILRLREGDDWLLTGCHYIRHVQISASSRVVVLDARRLETINGHHQDTDLEISSAPLLKRVSGKGGFLSVDQSGPSLGELAITGRWFESRITNAGLRYLRFPNGRKLTLCHCAALDRVEFPLDIEVDCEGAPPPQLNTARLLMDETVPRQAMKAIQQGDHSGLGGFLRSISSRCGPMQEFNGLQMLKALCATEVDPAQLWEARMALSAYRISKYRDAFLKWKGGLSGYGFERAETVWAWNFPTDTTWEGWEADLDIWHHCHGRCDSAERYRDTLIQHCDNAAALAAVVRQGSASRAPTGATLLMQDTLAVWARRGLQPMLLPHQIHDSLIGSFTLLITKHTLARADQLLILSVAAPFLFHYCDIPRLESLLRANPSLIRGWFMQIATGRESWIKEHFQYPRLGGGTVSVRRVLKELALAPVPPAQLDYEDLG